MALDQHVVVTGVGNRAHLIYVASYLRSLLSKECQHLTVAHVGGPPGLGRIVVTEQDVRDLLPTDPRLSITFPTGADRWQLPRGREVAYVAVGAPGLKPYGRLLRANRGRPVPTVVTDEGLGSYGDLRTRCAAWSRQGVPQPWRTVRAVAVETGLRTLTTQRWALYTETPAGWTVDERVAAEFRRRTTGAESQRDPGTVAGELAPHEQEQQQPTAVLLTQPWTTLGVVTADGYLGHVRAVEQHVRGRGLQLVVRPHPGEDPQFYRDFAVADGDLPAELDPRVVGADLVLGGPSTALLNLAAVHGRPAQLVSPSEIDLTTMLGARQRALFDTFVTAEHPALP